MPVFFISFVTMVRQWYHAKGWWIKLVNLFFSQLFPSLSPPFWASLPLLSPSLRSRPTFHPPASCRGLKKHRWSLLTCYSSLCQKLCQNNAPQHRAEGFYLFLLTGPVNFTDVSLGLNHQLISFVLIKRLILNMNRADNERRSVPEPQTWSCWSMKQAGRGRKLKSRRKGGESGSKRKKVRE